MSETSKVKVKRVLGAIALLPLLVTLQPGLASQDQAAKTKVVYVCACLKSRSCECMTEAKTPGPCSCGTAGGPPMKAVPRDSDWAKTNREALAN